MQRIYATWVETDIPGLPTLHAVPRSDQIDTARRLGYGNDIDALTRDHDTTHAAMCDWLGLPASFSLTMAAGGEVDADLAEAEEAAVMALQRFMRLAGVTWL